MGTYLNPGNSGFSDIVRDTYVDKTGLISCINHAIDTPQKLICVSRSRRFGKSFAAKIKDKQYRDAIRDYGGDVLLVGINYDTEKKTHECRIGNILRADLEYKKKYHSYGIEKIYAVLHIMTKKIKYRPTYWTIFRSNFADKVSSPKYYFRDNGLLNLFLTDKDTALLENVVALYLYRKYGVDGFFFLKSAKTGIDVDFYVQETGAVYQVAYAFTDSSRDREINNLVKLHKGFEEAKEFYIVTYEEERVIEEDGVTVNVVPAYKLMIR